MKELIKTFVLFIALASNFSLIAQEYKVDSVVLNTQHKQFITSQKFNPKKNLIETIQYEKLKSSLEIQKTDKVIELFDKDNNVIESSSFFWNTETGQWNEEQKTENKYNTDNVLTELTLFKFRDGKMRPEYHSEKNILKDTIIEIDSEFQENKIKTIYKSLTIKNSSDNVIYNEKQIWNDSLNKLEKSIKTITHYENDTIIIGYEVFEWNHNQWLKAEKVEYEFDKNNNPTNNYTIYSTSKQNWVPQYKREKIALPKENKKLDLTYKFSEKKNDWYIYSKIEIFFNEQGKEQDIIGFEFDEVSQQLKLNSEQLNLYDNQARLILSQNIFHHNKGLYGYKNIYKYDKEGNICLEETFELDKEKDQWKTITITEYIFDRNIILAAEKDTNYYQKFDYYNLNTHNYISNTFAVKKVNLYRFNNEKKILFEEYDYFYSKID